MNVTALASALAAASCNLPGSNADVVPWRRPLSKPIFGNIASQQAQQCRLVSEGDFGTQSGQGQAHKPYASSQLNASLAYNTYVTQDH